VIHGRLYRAADQTCLFAEVARTANFIDRMRGLLGTPPLSADKALLITPCASVHTFGMSYTIDLAFLDHGWTVIKTVPALRPWRMAACPAAGMVLEMAEGGLAAAQLACGTKLEWRELR
jgi:uncharacterized membrane protein (UPF0127 family)